MPKPPMPPIPAPLAAALFMFVMAAIPTSSATAQGWFDFSRSEPRTPPPSTSQSSEVAELSLRIDRLEELVRRLNGEIEMLRHRLGETGSAVGPAATGPAPPPSLSSGAVADPAFAVNSPSYGTTAPATTPGTAATTGAGQPTSLLPPRGPDAYPDTGQVLGAPERPLGSIPASALEARQGSPAPAPAPAPAPVATLAPASAATTPPPAGPQATVAALDQQVIEEAYNRAYRLLAAEDYASAEVEFRNFISRYPGHQLAGNAQYWLAESLYARGDYRRAAQEFLTGYQTYGSSKKAPDSLLKLGMTLAALGQNEQACASFAEMATRFPDAEPAVLERARSERGRVGC